MIDFRELVKAGVHFGHQTSRWSPSMAPYIWGMKNKVHLIDVSKTAFQLEKAAIFLQQVSAEGKQVLWVGTKRSAQASIKECAGKLNMPYVSHRWIGGTLSNYSQVKKSVTRLLHYEDILAKAKNFPHYTKKELNVFQKIVTRLQASIGGIVDLSWPVGAVIIVDVTKEHSALKEATSMGIPVIALVDTNGDPSLVDYVIPANDDSSKSIKVILDYLAASVDKGLATRAQAVQLEKEKLAEQAKAKVAEAKKKADEKASEKPKVAVAPKVEAPKPAAVAPAAPAAQEPATPEEKN